MKKYFGLLAFCAITLGVFTACSKDSEEDDDIANYVDGDYGGMDSIVVEYPEAIDNYVLLEYPNQSIEEVELERDGGFEVELDDGTELVFDAAGNFVAVDGDDEDDYGDEDADNHEDEEGIVDQYPEAIDSYLAANYQDVALVQVELEDNGTYEVELEDGTELVFDPDGTFIGLDD